MGYNGFNMFDHVEKIIGPYKRPQAEFNPYDPRAVDVANLLKEKIEALAPDIKAEHIGSTAVPGCPGKGIVDMMTLYPDGGLDTNISLLKALGFQRQGREFKNRFPDERPVMMGTYEHDGTSFLVYIHVIHRDSYEAERFRIFRDRLKNDPGLFNEYVEIKRRIIDEGVIDSDEYVERKRAVIEKILGKEYYDREWTEKKYPH